MPSHRNDYDWGGCADMLLEDTDVLLLFDTELESIADPQLPANQDLGIGDLRPATWFTPFHSATRNRDYSAAN
ncbi:hypothetical protein GXW82_42820 [Streptacidiphilus sp. 4-A2]|nr:hypothetical protein [Streptacidiphilus sp. 4-A2]